MKSMCECFEYFVIDDDEKLYQRNGSANVAGMDRRISKARDTGHNLKGSPVNEEIKRNTNLSEARRQALARADTHEKNLQGQGYCV